MAHRSVKAAITQIGYAPPTGYDLDLEIFPISALRQRVSAKRLQLAERIAFYMLIYVSDGCCRHMVDFEFIDCEPGSLLILQPEQVHRFDMATDWQGWVMLYRPEFREPRKTPMSADEQEVFQYVEDLPIALALDENQQQWMAASIACMFADTQRLAERGVVHAILRYQLYELLIRLYLYQSDKPSLERADPSAVQRFKRYRSAIAQHFYHWHRVSDYAKFLGCSEKTLGRTTLEVAGVNAKTYLSQRIALEAKRLLFHTDLSVSLIAESLGFEEATNFVKFFRREVGCAPGEFRKRNLAH